MRSPARAIVWELWRPLRWVVAVLLAGMIVLSVLLHALPAGTVDPKTTLGMSIQLVAWILFFALVVFTYTSPQTDLAGMWSTFPARMFVLPVRTNVLVGWPMLLGTVFVASTWLVTGLVLAGRAVAVPLWWPALGLAAFMAWFQAAAWCPFRLPWLRVVVALLLLSALVTVPLLALHYGWSDAALAGVFAGLIPPAYLAALIGVSRARRGDALGWWPTRKESGVATLEAARHQSFSSPARAQTWYEWRRHWLDLPFTTFCLLGLFVLGLWIGTHPVFEMAFRALEEEGVPPQLRANFIGLIVLVPLLAVIAGVSLGNTGNRDFILPAFLAVRPVSDGALVAAKLKAAASITLVCWGMVLVAVPVALLATGTWNGSVGWILEWLREQPPLIIGAFALVVIAVFIGGTWANLAASMFLGLLGRATIVYAALVLAFLAVIPVALLQYPEYRAALADSSPWLLGSAVALKAFAGAWVIRGVRRAGLAADRLIARVVGVWILAVAALFGLLCALVPEDAAPRFLLACGVVLLAPITRLLAAPLALAWNRHR